jgi:hypothetical protein
MTRLGVGSRRRRECYDALASPTSRRRPPVVVSGSRGGETPVDLQPRLDRRMRPLQSDRRCPLRGRGLTVPRSRVPTPKHRDAPETRAHLEDESDRQQRAGHAVENKAQQASGGCRRGRNAGDDSRRPTSPDGRSWTRRTLGSENSSSRGLVMLGLTARDNPIEAGSSPSVDRGLASKRERSPPRLPIQRWLGVRGELTRVVRELALHPFIRMNG